MAATAIQVPRHRPARLIRGTYRAQSTDNAEPSLPRSRRDRRTESEDYRWPTPTELPADLPEQPPKSRLIFTISPQTRKGTVQPPRRFPVHYLPCDRLRIAI
jgi:hypothetical protein